MAQVQRVMTGDVKMGNVAPIRRSPLTPGLAAAAKRFGLHPDAVKRHEEFEKDRLYNLERMRLERDATKAKYDALRGTVDELVGRIQDVAQAPNQAQAGDIQNIRVLLKQAIVAMERQQVELKGIRARTQRMERAALKADNVHQEVGDMRNEIVGYQRALHTVRQDMSLLMDLVEGDGGLKDLQKQIGDVRCDLDATRTRTSLLERGAEEQSARTLKLEQDVATMRAMLESNMNETAGVAGALLSLRADVQDLRKKVGRYIIDQIAFLRKA
ncbi:MAG: hypothetical protein HWE34_13320 [Methylocystaceae bacterium]|nr:hypothetical protein [Methylocystaceae bacterium]